jgi:hypothetical protein
MLEGLYAADDAQRAARTSDSVLLIADVGHAKNQFSYLGLQGVLGWQVPSFSTQTLQFVSHGGEGGVAKFKIISVASC